MFNPTAALANSQVARGRKLKHTEPLSLFKGEEFSKIVSTFSRLKKKKNLLGKIKGPKLSANCCNC